MRMQKIFKKIFGGLNITWPKLVIFAILMGLYTALMAKFVPDGNSFHDIAVTPEWWVLPAILIIVNSKKPLEAALKTFVFFLISQPLIYLFQVPFSDMGWGLFGYYRYWFMITLLTFPGGFIGWFIKKDQWYSALILSVMTVYLIYTGVSYVPAMLENFPNHLISIIYCFSIVPIFIFAILKSRVPRLIGSILAAVSLVIFILTSTFSQPFEVYNNTFASENHIVFVGEPYISAYAGEAQGGVNIISNDSGYTIKMVGQRGKKYTFKISDSQNTYSFEYYYDDNTQSVVVVKK